MIEFKKNLDSKEILKKAFVFFSGGIYILYSVVTNTYPFYFLMLFNLIPIPISIFNLLFLPIGGWLVAKGAVGFYKCFVCYKNVSNKKNTKERGEEKMESKIEDLLYKLKNSKNINLSFRPNFPTDDNSYIVQDCDTINTETGIFLNLELIEVKSNKKVVFCIPDIKNILIPQDDNNYSEYHLECIVRPYYYKLKDLYGYKEQGIKIQDDEEYKLLDSSTMIYRILIKH